MGGDDVDIRKDRLCAADAELRPEIERVFDANFKIYGVRKVWHQMRRERFGVARCTVARLMKEMGLEGVIRGKKVKTTAPNKAQPCPLDKVNRQFQAPAPNVLWVSDFTYVPTWKGVHLSHFRDRRVRPANCRLAGQPVSVRGCGAISALPAVQDWVATEVYVRVAFQRFNHEPHGNPDDQDNNPFKA